MTSASKRSKTEKAAFIFSFLRAVSVHPELKDVDAMSALHVTHLVDDHLELYMSAEHLSKLLRKKSDKPAKISLARLRRYGFMVKISVRSDVGASQYRPNGGRAATDYRLSIPDEVLGKKLPETEAEHLGKKLPETKCLKGEVSGKKLPKQSGKKLPTITLEDTLDGAGARANAPHACLPSDRGSVINNLDDVLDSHDTGQYQRAPKAPDGPLGADAVSDPEHPRDRPIAPVSEDDAPMPGNDLRSEVRLFEGTPVTLPDLKAQAAEEAAAVAICDLSRLHGAALPNPSGFVTDLEDWILGGWEEAAMRASQAAALMIIRTPTNRVRVWNEHNKIVASVLQSAGVRRGAMEAALKNYHDAVGDAGQALKAQKLREQTMQGENAHV